MQSGVFLSDKVFRLDLTPREFRVLTHIINEGECRCTAADLRHKCRLREGAAIEVLGQLVKRGLIHRGKDGKGFFIRAITGLGDRRAA